ncbi:MAG TPA: hypothetical protein VJZ71_02735 [Phycisphaerae bacterium]|nr:hypothetical protein [Phycisphaerae bacterium]
MSPLAFLLPLAVLGQTAPLADTGPLADAYVDGTYGYSINPPKGWQITRQRVPERRGVTLLQMTDRVSPTLTQEIVLKQSSTTQKVPMDEMLKRISDALELEFSDVTILAQQTQQIAGRPGAILSASFFHEGVKRLRLEAVVEHKPQSYYILLYSGPLALRAQSEPLFHRVLGSLQLLADQVDETRMKDALESGVRLLRSISGEQLKAAILPEEFLKFESEGRTIGFVAVYQAESTWEPSSKAGAPDRGYPGIRIRERGWTFEKDGRARRLQNSMFISYDLKHERWKTSVTTLVPATGNQPEYLDIALEEGLRTGDVLLTNQTYSMGAPAQANPALQLPEAYVSRAVIRLLPRLIDDLAKKQSFAFVTFDHGRAGLVARVIECQGEDSAAGIPSNDGVFRLEDREGLAADPTRLYVDGAGRTLLVKTGPLTMTRAEGQELSRLFSDRIDAAQKRMAELEEAYNREDARVGRKPK